MKVCVISSYPTSIKKVATGIYKLARKIGLDTALYTVWDRPPINCKFILVEYAEETQLVYDSPFLLKGNAVVYLTAEGIPRLSKEIIELLNKNIVYVPHRYVKEMIESAGIRVEGVIPHHIEWQELRRRIITHQFGYSGINLLRKGVDIVFEMARRGGSWLISTTRGEVKIPGDIPVVLGGFHDIFDFYARIGVYVLPSRAEGYGLAPREFTASTGIKSVVTDLPVFDDCDCYIKCPVREIKKVFYRGQIQEWREVDKEKCIPRMEISDISYLRKLGIDLYMPLLEHLKL